MLSLRETWDAVMRSLGVPAGEVCMSAGMHNVLSDRAIRDGLMESSPEEQASMLQRALKEEPAWRPQLAEASAAWDTWKRRFVVNRLRQVLGNDTTQREMEALVNAYRRMVQWEADDAARG
jgi:hypothetical protein